MTKVRDNQEHFTFYKLQIIFKPVILYHIVVCDNSDIIKTESEISLGLE